MQHSVFTVTQPLEYNSISRIIGSAFFFFFFHKYWSNWLSNFRAIERKLSKQKIQEQSTFIFYLSAFKFYEIFNFYWTTSIKTYLTLTKKILCMFQTIWISNLCTITGTRNKIFTRKVPEAEKATQLITELSRYVI